MAISFNPPLDTATVLAVPLSYRDNAELDLTFTAKFDSADNLLSIQRDSVRVELWSNIPSSGRNLGDWGALEFTPEDSVDASEDAEHASITTLNEQTPNTTLHLRFTTRIPARGTQFSYTYRLVYPNGDVKWLGQYGRDGVLLIERADPRVKLAAGARWTTRASGELVSEHSQDAYEVEVARLNSDLAWSAWVVDRAGHAAFHDTLSQFASSSTASLVVLLPSTPEDALVVNHPLILAASNVGSLSIAPSGSIRVKAADNSKTELHFRTYDGTWDLRAFVQDTVASTDTSARLVSVHPESGHALFGSSEGSASQELAFIPFTSVDVSARAVVLPNSLNGLMPSGHEDQLCIVKPGDDHFTFVSPCDDPLLLAAGPTGGRMLVTTSYGLPGSSLLPEMSVVVLGPHELEDPLDIPPVPISQLPSPPMTPQRPSKILPPRSIDQVLQAPPATKTVQPQVSSPLATWSTLKGASDRLTFTRTDTADTVTTTTTNFTTATEPMESAGTDVITPIPISTPPISKPAVSHVQSTPSLKKRTNKEKTNKDAESSSEYLPFPPSPRALLSLAASRMGQRHFKRSLVKSIIFGLVRASAVLFGFVVARILGALGVGRIVEKIQEQTPPARRALGSRMSRVGLGTGSATASPMLSPAGSPPRSRHVSFSDQVRERFPEPAMAVAVAPPSVQEEVDQTLVEEPIAVLAELAKEEVAMPAPIVHEIREITPPRSPLLLFKAINPSVPSLHFNLGAGPRTLLIRPVMPIKPSALIQGLCFKLDNVVVTPELTLAPGGVFSIKITGDAPGHLSVSHSI